MPLSRLCLRQRLQRGAAPRAGLLRKSALCAVLLRRIPRTAPLNPLWTRGPGAIRLGPDCGSSLPWPGERLRRSPPRFSVGFASRFGGAPLHVLVPVTPKGESGMAGRHPVKRGGERLRCSPGGASPPSITGPLGRPSKQTEACALSLNGTALRVVVSFVILGSPHSSAWPPRVQAAGLDPPQAGPQTAAESTALPLALSL